MITNIIYLLLFLITFFLFVFCFIKLFKNKKFVIVTTKNNHTQNRKMKILFVILAFILISFLLNIIYAFILTIFFVYVIWLFSKNKKQKNKKEIDKQILEVIRLFKNSVSSGENIVQTIDTVSQQIKEPLSLELKKISKKIKLGISLDEALEDSVKTINNEQYKFFMDTLRISHSTGIKISDILSKIEESVTQKLYLSNKVDVLTSQVRFSGIVISIVPFFILILIYFVEPEIVSILFSSILGNVVLLVCVIMIISGSFIMKKIADIKL